MEKSNLEPFVREGLDILFVGLNPARGSSRNGHYFSVNAAFWNQLYESGLITESVSKDSADEVVFGSNRKNVYGWQYGVTDLLKEWAESNSGKIKPSEEDCKSLMREILQYKPRAVVLLHSKVSKKMKSMVALDEPLQKYGYMGKCKGEPEIAFFAIPFPHGNSITSQFKVQLYKEIHRFLTEHSE